jgi:hypothetical protein
MKDEKDARLRWVRFRVLMYGAPWCAAGRGRGGVARTLHLVAWWVRFVGFEIDPIMGGARRVRRAERVMRRRSARRTLQRCARMESLPYFPRRFGFGAMKAQQKSWICGIAREGARKILELFWARCAFSTGEIAVERTNAECHRFLIRAARKASDLGKVVRRAQTHKRTSKPAAASVFPHPLTRHCVSRKAPSMPLRKALVQVG